jgi:multiple sugar transport system substrate-binding protein
VEAVVLEGRTYAVPWYVDVGVLYWRTDLVRIGRMGAL